MLLHAGALWQGQAGGKLAVMGSVAMYDDKWLDSEDNSKLMDWLFRWLKPVSTLEWPTLPIVAVGMLQRNCNMPAMQGLCLLLTH